MATMFTSSLSPHHTHTHTHTHTHQAAAYTPFTVCERYVVVRLSFSDFQQDIKNT